MQQKNYEPSKACPSVWIPLSQTDKEVFMKNTRGWLGDWDTEANWTWLESLLQTETWTQQQIVALQNLCDRGFGYAMDQLVGKDTNCQWGLVKENFLTAPFPFTFEECFETHVKTSEACLLATMNQYRSKTPKDFLLSDDYAKMRLQEFSQMMKK